MGIFKKLFSIKHEKSCSTYRFFGIKIFIKNKKYFLSQVQESIKIQNVYDLKNLEQTKKLIVFLIPEKKIIAGGVMSIFSLCRTTRELCKDCEVIISTIPGNLTYAQNDMFENDEKIYRWEQITDSAKNAKEVLIHLPEFFADKFFEALTKKDIEFLKSVENLHINIMNQNIELMPEPQKIKDLYNLSDNITQTIAHHRYSNQKICNKWDIPTHLFSCLLNFPSGKEIPFEDKEKTIVYSPDENKNKEKILKTLKENLNDYKFVEVNKISFNEFVELISKSLFTLTFGEGFDGYFIQPAILGSLGFAVYNDDFFPDESWKSLINVFDSYEEMAQNLVQVVRTLEKDKEKYLELSKLNKSKHDELYSTEKYKERLRNFYNKNYDFYPNKKSGVL